MLTPSWHALSLDVVTSELDSDRERGLSASAAAERLVEHGANRLATSHHTPAYRILLRQFADVLIAILAVAAAVSFAVGEPLDACAILAILLLNGLLGFVQEWRAEQALAALQGMLAPQATVLRAGRAQVVSAESLVPGDVVSLSPGERVSADLRLVEVRELDIDESALTGESVSVAKDDRAVERERPLAERTSMAWMGTVVTRGRGLGLVVATGMSTEFGRIAELTRSVRHEPTPLQRRLAKLGKQLGLLALAVSTLVGLSGWWLGRPGLEMFMTGVSLAVAVVPEGLPAVVTVTLALGVRQMVKRRALPRRLQATETLGSATLILTDKTGTLTENEMTVSRIWLASAEVAVTGSGYAPVGGFEREGNVLRIDDAPDLRALLKAGRLCNHASIEQRDGAWERVGEPTEAALIVAATKAQIAGPATDHSAEFAFDSTRKRMTVVREEEAERIAYAKGAPEVLLERCTRILVGDEERELGAADRERVLAAYQGFARGGMRTLALAQRSLPSALELEAEGVECELTLLGIVGIIDPPRPEVRAAIERATASGIEVMMITGDAPETARAIAEQINLPLKRVLTGPELDELSDTALLAELRQPMLLARATPEHKLRVVRLMRGVGEVVAMTGDGVNDAPALKQADIGIAMGLRGTDVAREASDLVLLDDNFASIVNAIEEGRREADNIRKFVRYLLSSNIGETVAIFLTIVLGWPLILLPVQILWINVVTDAVTAIALGLEPPEAGLMRRAPRRHDAPILDRAGMLSVLLLGGYIGLVTLGLFHLVLRRSPDESLLLAQTLAFTAMVVLEQVNLLNHRALHAPLRTIGFFSNPWLIVALIVTLLLHLAAIYTPFLQRVLHTTPLGWEEWGLLIVAAVPLFVVPEALKCWRWRRASAPTSG